MEKKIPMNDMCNLELNILDAMAKTRIVSGMLESAIKPDQKLPIVTKTELKDICVLLADVQDHLEAINETLFPEAENKAA